MHPRGVQLTAAMRMNETLHVQLMHPRGVQLYCLKVRANAVLIWCLARTYLGTYFPDFQYLQLPDLDFRSDMFACTSRYLFLKVQS